MNKIVKLTKEIITTGIYVHYMPGDLFYVESYEAVEGTNNYYPIEGGYPIWDRTIDMESITELVEETNKPKEYWLHKRYSQYELDKILKEKTDIDKY